MNEDSKPVYKEAWFWVVFAPLILIVFVCAALLKFAIVGGDDRVVDDYYKQGRMINNRFSAESLAQELAVTGNLAFDNDAGLVRLILNGTSEFKHPQVVLLRISHPAQSDLDFSVPLQKSGADRYQAPWRPGVTGKRYLILTGVLPSLSVNSEQTPSWRVSSEIDFGLSTGISFPSTSQL